MRSQQQDIWVERSEAPQIAEVGDGKKTLEKSFCRVLAIAHPKSSSY